MSVVPKEAIEVIAQSIGITNFSSEVSLSLAPDVEYRLREIMQEAIKCMRHSRRITLTADDVDSALSLRNVDPIYGFASGDARRFKRAAGHKDLYYVDDKDVEFKDVVEAPLPKAIEGVQPAIPENAPVEASADGKRSEYKEDGSHVDIKVPVKHVLSRELHLYFEKITELITKKPHSVLFKQALLSLRTDSGLHALVPYFTYFIADEVSRNLNNFPLLFSLMRVAKSLLQNPHIHIEPYLHQLMPSIITCLAAKRLGNRFSDNHWELRNFTANLLASICKRFGHVYHNLQSRVTKTLLHAFLDPTKSLPQHYGAIQGLAALGPSVIRLLILPNLEPYLLLLEPEMLHTKQKNEIKRHEAWRVYEALMCAAGLSMYDRVKPMPILLASPSRGMWKSSGRVLSVAPTYLYEHIEGVKWILTLYLLPPCVRLAIAFQFDQDKRKASTDNLLQQPPLKKIATEGSMGMMTMNSLTTDMQGFAGGFPTAVGPSSMVVSSMSRQFSNENISGERLVGGNRRPHLYSLRLGRRTWMPGSYCHHYSSFSVKVCSHLLPNLSCLFSCD